MRYLWVGDPHVQPHDLVDAHALANLIFDTGEQKECDALILAGDLYDTHAIIHAEVQLFWHDFFVRAKDVFEEVVVIKGNHDAPGVAGTRATALLAHVNQAMCVISEPLLFKADRVLFCPYQAEPRQLLMDAMNHAGQADILFCHQTFDGARYDNGVYAPKELDPELFPQRLIVSGHLHTPQEFGKVWYPGAPRWRHLGDANVARAIWVLDIQGGAIVAQEPVDTGAVCRKVVALSDVEGAPMPPDAVFSVFADGIDRVHVQIVGSRDWIRTRVPLWEGRARVQTTCTDARPALTVRESDGTGVAFGKWVDAFQAPRGTERPLLKQLARERLHAAV